MSNTSSALGGPRGPRGEAKSVPSESPLLAEFTIVNVVNALHACTATGSGKATIGGGFSSMEEFILLRLADDEALPRATLLLCEIMRRGEYEDSTIDYGHTRNMAALFLMRHLDRKPDCSSYAYNIWGRLLPEEREQVKDELRQACFQEGFEQLANLLGEVWSLDGWPELVAEVLAENIPDEPLVRREFKMCTLAHIARRLERSFQADEFLHRHLTRAMAFVLTACRQEGAPAKLRCYAYLCLRELLPAFDTEDRHEVAMLVETISQGIRLHGNEVHVFDDRRESMLSLAVACLNRCLAFTRLMTREELAPAADATLQLLAENLGREDTNSVEPEMEESLEFWTSLCDAASTGERVAIDLLRDSLPRLVPLLQRGVVAGINPQDERESPLADRASMCLECIAPAVGEDLFEILVPFVKQNINHDHWSQRVSAAVSLEVLLNAVPQLTNEKSRSEFFRFALTEFLAMTKDPVPRARAAAFSGLSRIFQEDLCHEVSTQATISIAEACTEALRDREHSFLIKLVIYTLFTLCTFVADSGLAEAEENVLDRFVDDMVDRLWQICFDNVEPVDGDEKNVAGEFLGAFETLSSIMTAVSHSHLRTLEQSLPPLLDELSRAFSSEGKVQASEQRGLCAVLSSLLSRFREATIAEEDTQRLVDVILTGIRSSDEGTVEEAMLVLSAFASVCEDADKCLVTLFPPLLEKLFVTDQARLELNTAVANGLGSLFQSASCIDPYFEPCMASILPFLGSPLAPDSELMAALHLVGDAVLTSPTRLPEHLPSLLEALLRLLVTAELRGAHGEADSVALSVVEGLTCLFQGLAHLKVGAGDPVQEHFTRYGAATLMALEALSVRIDLNRVNMGRAEKALIKSLSGLIIDLTPHFKSAFPDEFRKPWIDRLGQALARVGVLDDEDEDFDDDDHCEDDYDEGDS